MKHTYLFAYILLCTLCALSCGLDNGLGRTPQMAWNSWNTFGCNINEDLIKDTANALIKTGLADAGYNYINMDDCWALNRNESGYVQADPKDFPSGIKALADYVHKLGLKFGLYSDAGTLTCGGRPGSLGYEVEDATQYAAWEVDYLKFDNCYNEDLPDLVRYPPMRDALNKTGRPIFFSLCDWTVTTAVWGPMIGNSWRTTTDIYERWESILSNIDQNNAIAGYSGPGAWNDPDMLEVGVGPITYDENIAHFSLWSIAKAPLILGNDLRKITPDVVEILTNKEVIAVNQDSLGKQGARIAHEVSTNPKVYGNLVFLDECKGLPSQLWSFSTSTKRIESKHVAGQCVGQFSRNWDCKPSQGAQLYLQPCNTDVECGGKAQQWDFGNNRMETRFQDQSTPSCIELVAGTDSEVMVGWECLPQGGLKQKWSLNADGTIVNKQNGRCLTVSSGSEVWGTPLSDGSHAVVLLNRAASAQNVSVNFKDIGFSGSVTVRDLWAKADKGSFTDAYSVSVNSHGAAMLKIAKK